MPTQTCDITFMDDVTWTFTNVTYCEPLTNPDRLVVTGTRNGTTGTWSFPWASIKSYKLY